MSNHLDSNFIFELEWLREDIVEKLFSYQIFTLDKLYIYLSDPYLRMLLIEQLKVKEHDASNWKALLEKEFPNLVEERLCELGPLAFGAEEPSASIEIYEENHRKHYIDLVKKQQWDNISNDLRSDLAPVRDQRGRGFCWAFSAAAVAEQLIEKDFIGSVKFLVQTVKTERRYFETQSPNKDGENPKYAGVVMYKYGLLSEEDYPYDENLDRSERPDKSVFEKAKNNRLGDMIDLYGQNVSMRQIAGTYSFNSDVKPRLYCLTVPLFNSFLAVGHDGLVPLPLPNESIIGWHAMVIVGVRVIEINGQSFSYAVVRNSWGKHWCEEGYCYIPFEYIEEHARGIITMLTKNEVSQFSEQYLLRNKSASENRGWRFVHAAIKVASFTIMIMLIVTALALASPLLSNKPGHEPKLSNGDLGYPNRKNKVSFQGNGKIEQRADFDHELERLIQITEQLYEESLSSKSP